MTGYGLPGHGELNWDAKVSASVEAVKATADAALPSASLDANTAALAKNPASSLAGALTATYAALGANRFTADQTLGNASGDIVLSNRQTTANIRALQVLPVDQTQGTGLVVVSGTSAPTTGLKTQIMLYGANDAGNVNYDRFAITAYGPSDLIIDSTYGGTGAARNITFQMGGSAAAAHTTIASGSNGAVLPQATINVASTTGFLAAGTLQIGNDQVTYTGKTATSFTGCSGGTGTLSTGQNVYGLIHGQNAITIYADASVDLNGGGKVIDGKTFGATRTRISDPMDTGATQLIIDTRTQTGTNNAADSSALTLARGGVSKWNFGLNYSGTNVDSLDWYNRTNSALRMQLLETGELLVRGDAPSNYGGVLQLVNTGASGHSWRIGEFNGAGTLAFRDTTTGNFPLQLGSAGGAGFWGHTPPATQPVAPTTLADVIAIIRGCGLSA